MFEFNCMGYPSRFLVITDNPPPPLFKIIEVRGWGAFCTQPCRKLQYQEFLIFNSAFLQKTSFDQILNISKIFTLQETRIYQSETLKQKDNRPLKLVESQNLINLILILMQKKKNCK